MENLDFSGTTDITKLIESTVTANDIPQQQQHQLVIEEKKLDESQMMEFSSSVSDLMPVGLPPSQDVYTNPTNGRVSGITLSDPPPQQKRSQNPFNLTDDQFNAVIAGVVAVIIFSTTVQTKLAGLVPNFGGINGSIANVLAAAVLYFFAHRFIKKNV
jgi:hypothetical protein